MRMAIGKISILMLTVSILLMTDLFWNVTEIFFLYEYFLPFPPEVNKTRKLLIIGIMSAQNHFKERESIRNTWGTIYGNHVDLKFLIGTKICPVPPADRVTPYDCEKWSVSTPKSLNFTTNNFVSRSRKLLEGYDGFTFLVKHNISIVRLGVLSNTLKNCEYTKSRVFLFDATSGHKIASATFVGANSSNNGFYWKTVPVIKVPNEFEGELVLVGDGKLNVTCSPNMNNDGVIQILELQRKGVYTKFNRASCILVAFSYFIENDKQLRKFINGRKSREKEWETETKILQYQLEIENKAYNDILFFNVVDVYKNIVFKLYDFLKWTQNSNGYKFVLKTDDDVFLDIKQIIYILMLNLNNDWDWWSCVRQNYPPPKSGKWRDRLYKEKNYPLFPSGAGYVITKRMVSTILTTNTLENITAGEDVTFGMWIQNSEKRFPNMLNTSFCYWACGIFVSNVRPCNVPQLTWQQMHQLYQLVHEVDSCEPMCPLT